MNLIQLRLAPVAVAALALINGAAAQGGLNPTQTCLDYYPTNSVDWPASGLGAAADFTRIIAGNFDGTEDPDGIDLVGLVGTNLVYLPRLHFQTAMYDIPLVAAAPTDIEVLRHPMFGGQDSLLVADEYGLHRMTFTGSPSYTLDTLSVGTAWNSATMLHTADLDQDGAQDDVVALAADGVTVLVMLDADGASPVATSFTASDDVLDIETVEWANLAGPAALEIAVLAEDGMTIYKPDGSFVRFFAHAALRGQIARIQTGGALDLLAWTRPKLGQSASEVVVVELLTVHVGPLAHFDLCGTSIDVQPVTSAGGDYNDDGLDDLFITHQENETAVVLINQGTAPWFTTTGDLAYDVIPLSSAGLGTGAGNLAIPVFEDLDGAGRADIVQMVSTTGTIEVWLRAPFQRQLTTGEPESSADIARTESGFTPGDATTTPPEAGQLEFAFNVPVTDPVKTHIEVLLAVQDDPLNNYVDEDLLYHAVHPLATGSAQVLVLGDLETLLGSTVIDPGDIQTGYFWTNKRHYYMRYRFVTADVSGSTITITNPGRWFTGGWTIRWEDFPAAYSLSALSSYMLSEGGITDSEFTLLTEVDISGGSGAGTALGAYVPMQRTPPFPPGQVPTLPAVSVGPATTTL
ncbi:hypothetical protein [Engelhardtia mirabilis]|uniref:FG-GAP repeat protein n=1 Tax=Engelhardtia mirabilis TaxID=2528011 RepID=A0A518BEW1_9BACT|nr:hypothetical protein Pla133_05670 [Planctomycetes bacterium Pla133]QDU99828.1 hypothetical protein Pla86_05670 [Planctomycetes bacterium Pla86]